MRKILKLFMRTVCHWSDWVQCFVGNTGYYRVLPSSTDIQHT